MRNVFAMTLLATPWVFHTFGLDVTFYFIASVM